MSDRQAADAVRGRIDWKYALSLELTDPGFDFSVLSLRLVEQRRAKKLSIYQQVWDLHRCGWKAKAISSAISGSSSGICDSSFRSTSHAARRGVRQSFSGSATFGRVLIEYRCRG